MKRTLFVLALFAGSVGIARAIEQSCYTDDVALVSDGGNCDVTCAGFGGTPDDGICCIEQCTQIGIDWCCSAWYGTCDYCAYQGGGGSGNCHGQRCIQGPQADDASVKFDLPAPRVISCLDIVDGSGNAILHETLFIPIPAQGDKIAEEFLRSALFQSKITSGEQRERAEQLVQVATAGSWSYAFGGSGSDVVTSRIPIGTRNGCTTIRVSESGRR